MTEEQDFKLRPTADQNWVLFEAISKISETIARIDQYGCSLVRDKQYKKVGGKSSPSLEPHSVVDSGSYL